jgi:hypothetical protein
MENTTIPYQGTLQIQYTSHESLLASAPLGARLKKLAVFGGVTAFFTILLLVGADQAEIGWLRWVAYGVAGLGLLATVFATLSAKIAKCPYCDKVIGKGAFDSITSVDENERVECSHCHELLLSHQGKIRAFTQADASDKKSFDAPVYVQGIWPNECIACGARPTHFDQAKKVKVEFEKLLVGALSVSSGSVNGIPYCDAHRDMVTLSIKDDYPRLNFFDLDMRKRYLLVNQQAGKTMHVLKIKR